MVQPTIRFAAIGINHDHIYMQVECIEAAGGELVGFYAAEDDLAAEFSRHFPDARRVGSASELFEDTTIQLILTAAVPSNRAGIAVAAMRHGKDVMTDKPGATSLEQLAELRQVQAETGRIFSVFFEERFDNKPTIRACELVRAGAIGEFVHSLGLGPHTIRKEQRPAWFFERARYGGIIADIGSHQCDQFLYLANTLDVDVVSASVANRANPDTPELQDVGEAMLKSPTASGYFRLDWFTPAGMPVFGDCRLIIVGTHGTIDVRKYIDIGRSTHEPALFLTDHAGIRAIRFDDAVPAYGQLLVNDILERTETAMSQAHCFKATEIALRAQALAESVATLS